jgi:hypothetical protein
MANVRLNWTGALPTTRESGKPLAPEDIQGVRLELSADGGASFGVFDTYPTVVTEAVVTDLEPGGWVFRFTVIDTQGRESTPLDVAATVEDRSNPSPLTSVDVSVEY